MAIPGDIERNRMISKVSYELTVFADSLKPSPEYVEVGKATTQKVFERIKKDPRFSVDRTLLGGSVGKSTSVLYPDFDGVVFLNKKTPPFGDMVDAFKGLMLSEAKSFGISPDSISSSGSAVTVEFQNGTELDLLPAGSFSQDPEEQYKKVLELIKPCKENFWMFSSSLADIQIEFIRIEPGPTKQLIRLVKYWYKTLIFDEKVYGGSYLMEVLSVTVCHEYQKLSPKSVPLLELFKATLKKIAKIQTLKIAFLRQNKKWKLLPENEIGKKNPHFSSIILERPRFIIDPSNPYNDLLKNLSPAAIDQLKQSAEKMLKRVEALESVEGNDFKVVSPAGDVTIQIPKIFEPLTLSLKSICPDVAGIPTKIVIHYDYQYQEKSDAKIVVNTEYFLQLNDKAKKVSKAISTNLITLARNLAKRNDDGKKYVYSKFGLAEVLNKNDIKTAVGLFLNENFSPQAIQVSATNTDHKSCDVTLFVPYVFKGTNFAVRFSMKWK